MLSVYIVHVASAILLLIIFASVPVSGDIVRRHTQSYGGRTTGNGLRAHVTIRADGSLKAETSFQSPPSAPFGRWDEWHSRFPKLTTNKSVWFALGNQLWMEYVSGWAHPQGQTAFDKRKQNAAGEDERFSYHMQHAMNDMGASEAWNQFFNASNLAGTAKNLEGLNCTLGSLGESDCMNAFTTFEPQCIKNRTLPSFIEQAYPLMKVNCSSYTKGFSSAETQPLRQRKFDLLEAMIEDYYRSATGGTRNRLPHLAHLLASMAWLHPFNVTNSRIRNLILQTELLRSGGHPAVLWDYGQWIYGTDNLDLIQSNILHGWCNWELIVANGTSPFMDASLNRSKSARKTVQPAEVPSYNNQLERCRFHWILASGSAFPP